jgi:adenylylsulfate kinase
MTVVVSALTANEDARSYIKNHVDYVIIIYLECVIEKCIERDYKGLYRKALDGEIEILVGINTE